MKKVGIMLPIDTEVANEENYYTGEKVLAPLSEVNYELQVIQEGSSLANTGELTLYSVNSGRPGGGYAKSFEPEGFTFQIGGYTVYPIWEDDPQTGEPVPITYGTAMPRSFYEAFKFRYSFDQNEEAPFQSYLHALDFMQFKIENQPLSYNSQLLNQRLYSFRSHLFMAAELQVGNKRVVRLYKFDESEKLFKVFRAFDEIWVDDEGQDGSPDIFSTGNYLFVAYRAIDRDANVNNIVIWRTKDLGSWEVFEFPMGKSYSVDYDTDPLMNDRGFRLRGTSDGETVCIVIASRKTGLSSITYKQMKSFLSFDFCESLKENESGYASLATVEQNQAYETTQDYTGMLSMFAPQGFDDIQEDSGFNVNFALYYDVEMAAFVILKSGDPSDMADKDGDKAGAYLMAAKTYADDYSIWEPCLSLKLKDEVSIGGLGNSPFNMYTDAKLEDYKIIDMDVAALGGTNIISAVMDYKTAERPGSQQISQICCTTEFSFLTKERFSSIDYETPLLAIGARHHEDYLFAMSPLVPYSGGVMTQGRYFGNPESNSINVDSPSLAEHKHQIVSLSRIEGELSALAVGGQFINIKETRPYQINYCQHVIDISKFIFNPSTSGSHSYQEVVLDEKRWNAMSNDLGEVYWELIPYWTGNISNLEWRMKFKFRLFDDQLGQFNTPQNYPNLIPIFSFGDLSIELELKQYSIRVLNNGVLIGSISNGRLILDDYVEIMVAVESPVAIVSNPDRIMSCYWRSADGDWQTDFTPVSGADIPDVAEPMRFGKMSNDAGIIFGLGDIQIGNDWAYEPVFTARRGQFEDFRTFAFNGINFSQVPSGGYISSYRNQLNLSDGTILKITGDGVPSVDGDVFEYRSSPRGNLLSSIVDPFVNHVYDFSKYYNDNGSFEVELSNLKKVSYDSISFLNLHGVVGAEVEFGRYVSNSFVAEHSETFTMTQEEIIKNNDGEENLLSVEGSYRVHSLKGKTLVVYDSSGSPSDHFLIEDNTQKEIKLDREFTYHLDDTVSLYVVEDSQTFRFDEMTWPIIRVEFTVVPNGNKKIIGSIFLGTFADLSQHITEMQEDYLTESDLIESDFGRAYPSMIQDGVSYKEVSFSSPLIEAKDHAYVFNLIHQAYKYHYGKPFVINYEDYDGKLKSRAAVLSGTSSDSPSSYYRELEFSVMSQEATAFRENYFASTLTASLSYSPSSPEPGDVITFEVNAKDSLGGDLTYLWDFGDGTSEQTSSPNILHSYLTAGVKSVQCLITSSSGYRILRKLSVNVIDQST